MIKIFQINHIIHYLWHNGGSSSNIIIHKSKQEKLFILILTIGSQPSSSFLGIETSTLSFSSLDLVRALVICSVKAMLSELVWGSLAILCKKIITSERL